MKSVNIAQVKEQLSSYLTAVESGEEIVVCRRNRPVAHIVPVDSGPLENRMRLGSAKGSVHVHCDLTAPAMKESDWGMLT
jgi:prevent-host-death family protein